ncbi:hypothetical protein Lal_00041729 [Lupinus albus]|nr:hypothetical protein Lal_00041729 [Lupinus albus]
MSFHGFSHFEKRSNIPKTSFKGKKIVRIKCFTSSQASRRLTRLLALKNAIFSHFYQEGHFSPRRGNSHSGETALAQARILQCCLGFHSPRVSHEWYSNFESSYVASFGSSDVASFGSSDVASFGSRDVACFGSSDVASFGSSDVALKRCSKLWLKRCSKLWLKRCSKLWLKRCSKLWLKRCCGGSALDACEEEYMTAIDPCSEVYIQAYLNHANVQEALHANVTKLKYDWEPCSDIISNWGDSPSTIILLLHEFLNNALRVWIFSGDIDEKVSITSTKYSIKKMNISIKTAWYPWFFNGEEIYRLLVGGYAEVRDDNENRTRGYLLEPNPNLMGKTRCD